MMILRLRITFLTLLIAVALFALQAAKVMAETL